MKTASGSGLGRYTSDEAFGMSRSFPAGNDLIGVPEVIRGSSRCTVLGYQRKNDRTERLGLALRNRPGNEGWYFKVLN